MGKDCKFDCFKGFQECKSITFTDSVGNSFTMNFAFRAYCHGIVNMSWDSVTITLNGQVSNGIFTGNSAVPSHFGSKFALSTFMEGAYFQGSPLAVSNTTIGGVITFSGTTPQFRVLALRTEASFVLSSTLQVYGGSVSWAQD